jgi:hypothetical protein
VTACTNYFADVTLPDDWYHLYRQPLSWEYPCYLNDLYVVKVYKVIFESNVAVCAIPSKRLKHLDIGLMADKETVQWLALECADEKTAMEIGNKVVQVVWVYKGRLKLGTSINEQMPHHNYSFVQLVD